MIKFKKNILIFFSTAIAVLGVSIYHLRRSVENLKSPEVKVEYIVNEKQPNFFNKSPQEGLREALEYYEVYHPEIVYAQAVLETGWFTSSLCLNSHNLFGLYNSRTKSYYKFDHWSESVIAYLNYVQYKYKPSNDYYQFLKELPYATDPNYINKVKEIVKQNDNKICTKFIWQ